MPTPDLAMGDSPFTTVESIPDHVFAFYIFQYAKMEFVKQNLPNDAIPKEYLDEASINGDSSFLVAEKKLQSAFNQGMYKHLFPTLVLP